MYASLRQLLFCLDPETAHAVTLKALQLAHRLALTRCLRQPQAAPVSLFGLTFPNRIGLAAGLDKNGDYLEALAALGFGFVEVGTVTPKPQAGNPLPRLFRLPTDQAIINRMGFNNKGCEHMQQRLQQTTYKGIIGVNIGKNRDTPLENAEADYVTGFRMLAPYASYITINISSPNTESLRALQQADLLRALLATLKAEQAELAKHHKYIPLLVKIAPDVSSSELTDMAAIFLAEKIDGVIATNTTVSRDGLQPSTMAAETGGLSGLPLAARATAILQQLSALLAHRIPIIGSGGIVNAAHAAEKFAAGASLIQLYTGLIYQGPALIRAAAQIAMKNGVEETSHCDK